MSLRFSHTSNLTKLVIIIEFILVSYLLYSLTKNVYNSYKVDRYIQAFQEENDAIDAENQKKAEDYLYFTSPEYIDKIAKQNLNLVNPGEKVIILSADILDDQQGKENAETSEFAQYAGLSNAKQWWMFFFGD